jgi:integrase
MNKLVGVVRYKDRDHLLLRWKDPITGRTRCKTAGTAKRRDAERLAAALEREILEGQHGPNARMSWDEFRDYHEDHCLAALKRTTRSAYTSTLNVYERFARPARLSDVTAARVTAWRTHLRMQGKSEATIDTYVRHLKAVLRWAHEQGLLAVVPKIVRAKRSKAVKVMKGRPITTEEFERMLTAVPEIVGTEAAPEWDRYLRGLWWSGLRLGESLLLRWDDEPGAIVVDFTGRRPMLRIPAESEKGGQDRVLPMAPEFAAFLEKTPQRARVGRVFKLTGRLWPDAQMQADWVSRVVCRIGRKARVVVDQRERRLVVDDRGLTAKPKRKKKRKAKEKAKEKDDGIKRKYASAHDLRRAFGLRWAARVMPQILMQLMRHEDISTTMRYYVGKEAEATADVLWQVTGAAPLAKSNKSGNKRPSAGRPLPKDKPQTLTS